jgi:uncharacterized membrane protein YfcA
MLQEPAGGVHASTPRRSLAWLAPFIVWLGAFYAAWFVFVEGDGLWGVVAEHWPMSLTMAFGSFVAGSTPMGGGTVGFPVLVLLFDLPATLGRDFSFAVQSVGMVSASVFILVRRTPLATTMLKWACAGSLVGTPLGILFVAPHVSGLFTKLLFAVVWASFGVMHLWKANEISNFSGVIRTSNSFNRAAGLLLGFFGGGLVASITGVGIDMLIYIVLTLLCRADLKLAVPVSVILMACTSLVGLATKLLFTGLAPGVVENWVAAAPVVALGAPLGAYFVDRVGRKATLLFVSTLCVGQFAWTLHEEWRTLGAVGLGAAFAAVVLLVLGFYGLYRLGQSLTGEQLSR